MDPSDAVNLNDVGLVCECGRPDLLWHCAHPECLWIVCGNKDCREIVDGRTCLG